MSRATLPLSVTTTNRVEEAMVFPLGERILAEKVCAALHGKGVHPTADADGFRIVIRNFPHGPVWLSYPPGMLER